jgi:hypothetical protein
MSDLLYIAGAIWCICDLLSDKNQFLTFFCTKSQMWFGVRFRVRCLTLPLRAPNSTANRTANRMVRVNGSNSVSDTKLQMQQIASAIYSKSHMKSHTCNQPLSPEYKIIWIGALFTEERSTEVLVYRHSVNVGLAVTCINTARVVINNMSNILLNPK